MGVRNLWFLYGHSIAASVKLYVTLCLAIKYTLQIGLE